LRRAYRRRRSHSSVNAGMTLVGMPMRQAFGRATNGQARDGCRERERKCIRRIHRPSHDTIDTQSWTPAHRLIINTPGTRNPKIVSGGSTAS
jgi:hypothetical protein